MSYIKICFVYGVGYLIFKYYCFFILIFGGKLNGYYFCMKNLSIIL